MDEPATAVLIDRAQRPGGLRSMVGLSLLIHSVAVALLLMAPQPWSVRPPPSSPTMFISLGGAPGPRAGGMTPMGGRPIQAATTLPTPPRPQPVRPPAAKAPEMTVPVPGAKMPPKTVVKSAPPEARGRTPTQGAEEHPGSALAETGGRGMGFGLSTGGGGTGGYLDVGNFCCPEYLTTMLQLIQRNWSSKQQVAGDALIKFTIQRDGRISDVEVERSSGYSALDITAQRAVLLARQLPPLPPAFTENHLTVHLNFQYQR